MNPKGLVPAASITSHTSLAIPWQSMGISLTRATLHDREVGHVVPEGGRQADQDDLCRSERVVSRGEGEVVGFDPRPEVLLQRAWDREDAPAQVLDTGQVDVDPRHREAGRGGRT